MSRGLSLTGEKLTDGTLFEPDVFPDFDVWELIPSTPPCALVHPASGHLEPFSEFFNGQEFIHRHPPQALNVRCVRA